MLRFILFLSLLFANMEVSWAQESSVSWQAELQNIDQELGRLNDLRGRYASSASRKEADGNRLQFQNKLDARKAYAQAESDREVVQKIDSRIAYLQARKAQILTDHPN